MVPCHQRSKNQKMENNKKQLLERIKSANNVLVTVSANPSVDQLSAAIGLTLMLNKLDKHATAVYSGKTPSTIEFLHPENTLEKNTDSLRDFIIALDKSKADKLRYKVEEDHVKIFITPYRTSISQADLEFSQGDFNVELVIALGVNEQKDLDQAIISHGRILHDATTVAVTTGAASKLGSINWSDDHASSLCEMVASLADELQSDLLDAQVATALMTGIVAETDRFSNEKTLPGTMTFSAKLMAAGANQQLVASKLEEPETPPVPDEQPVSEDNQNKQASDGSLTIAHTETSFGDEEPEGEPVDKIHIDEHGTVQSLKEEDLPAPELNQNTLVVPEESPEEALPELPPQQPLPEIKNVKGGGAYLPEPDKPKDTELSVGNVPVGYEDPSDTLNAPPTDIPILNRGGDTSEEAGDNQQMESQQPDQRPDFTPVVEEPAKPVVVPEPAPEIPTPEPAPVEEEAPQTLSELEAAVQASYESNNTATPPVASVEIPPPAPETAPQSDTSSMNGLDSARDAVSEALASIGSTTPPVDVPPVSTDFVQPVEPAVAPHFDPSASVEPPVFTMPENLVPPKDLPADMTAASVADPTAPPAVPPPFMPDMNGFNDPTLPPQNGPAPSGPANPQNPFNLPPA